MVLLAPAALSNTHDLLARESWLGVELGEIVASELAPYRNGRSDRGTASGGSLQLDAKTGLVEPGIA